MGFNSAFKGLKHHNAAIFSTQQSSKNNGVERYVVGAQVGRKNIKYILVYVWIFCSDC